MAFFDLFKRTKSSAPAPATARPAPPVIAERPLPPVQADTPASPASEAALIDPGAAVAEAAAEVLHDGPERRERIRRNARPGTRVLLIDDSHTIVALLKRMLQQNQYEVLEAYDAESGIEIARREVPGLIFLDIVLPGMDGFSALRTLRRDPVTKDIPIIMISGNAQATEQFYVQRIGADDFMKKPFSRAEVFSRIEPLLDEDDIPRHTVRSRVRTEA
ncbi:MAG: response regulator [Thermomonas sp.]|uniref:response regulator n=1 Tax=Thermomonas sp. TaxID=1971895 RepID=UPI0039E4B1F5